MLCVKGPPEQEPEDGALDVTRGCQCPLPTEGSILGQELLDCTRMNEDQSTDENGADHLYSESPSQLREYLTQPSSEQTSSSESTVTSSESGSDILHMASGDLDCKPLCEKEEEARAASAMQGTSLAPAAYGDYTSVGVAKAASQLEAGEELRTTENGGKGSAPGGKACSGNQSKCQFR